MTEIARRYDPRVAGVIAGTTPAGSASALAAGATMTDPVTGVAPASQAVATTLAALARRRRAITSTTSIAASDLNGVVDITSGTFALTMPSSLGAGFACRVRNSGTGATTLTPSGGAATINGVATFVLPALGSEVDVYLDTVTAGAWIATPVAVTITRVRSSVASNEETTVALDTQLVATLQAGGVYAFRASLPFTNNADLEGVQVSLGGTATATAVIADVQIRSYAATPVLTHGRITAMAGAAIGQSIAVAGNSFVEIVGSITVNAAGTFGPSWAKNANDTDGAVTLARGAALVIQKIS